MKTKKPHQGLAFVLGPPAAGKTTISRAVALRMNRRFQTIDDWVGQVYQPEKQQSPMTDAQVDAALALLLENSCDNSICEFAYHDYVGLLERNACEAFGRSKKVIVVAPLAICKSRNEARPGRVREMYVERAWQSTQTLIHRCTSRRAGDFIVVDTTLVPVEMAVTIIVNFLNDKT